MMNTVKRIAAGSFVAMLAIGLAACATHEKKNKIAVEKFKQSTAGQFEADTGAQLFIAPVRARMVTDEAVYLERHDSNGNVFGRLLNVELSADGKKILLRALTFTQEGQWRNLRENPELFTALLPKDVRPAGTCDIQPSEDMNTLTYSCGGSAPETFRRKVQ
jgi:hypothetical protein